MTTLLPITLRPGAPADMPAILDLWAAAWAETMPEIDFEARREWLRERQAAMVAEGALVTLAEEAGAIVGYLLVNPATACLDQIAVRPGHWGQGVASALMRHAKGLCPAGLTLWVNQANPRAIRFYEREGFLRAGETVNPNSGLPVLVYQWTPAAAGNGAAPESSPN